MNYIASPKSARISVNNLPVAAPLYGIGCKVGNPVITHNDGKVIKMLKTTNNLLTANEMAAKLGISTSYVYAKLAKLQAHPERKEGKQAFYSQDLLEKMGTRQRRQRRAIAVNPQPKEHSKVSENLLDRVSNLEKQIQEMNFQDIHQALKDIKKVLGLS